jgi:hypothetical protein
MIIRKERDDGDLPPGKKPSFMINFQAAFIQRLDILSTHFHIAKLAGRTKNSAGISDSRLPQALDPLAIQMPLPEQGL